jgi:hypothetical protein
MRLQPFPAKSNFLAVFVLKLAGRMSTTIALTVLELKERLSSDFSGSFGNNSLSPHVFRQTPVYATFPPKAIC